MQTFNFSMKKFTIMKTKPIFLLVILTSRPAYFKFPRKLTHYKIFLVKSTSLIYSTLAKAALQVFTFKKGLMLINDQRKWKIFPLHECSCFFELENCWIVLCSLRWKTRKKLEFSLHCCAILRWYNEDNRDVLGFWCYVIFATLPIYQFMIGNLSFYTFLIICQWHCICFLTKYEWNNNFRRSLFTP